MKFILSGLNLQATVHVFNFVGVIPLTAIVYGMSYMLKSGQLLDFGRGIHFLLSFKWLCSL